MLVYDIDFVMLYVNFFIIDNLGILILEGDLWFDLYGLGKEIM